MRQCPQCARPNGPHFARCMACGEWLGVADADDGGPRDLADAEQRALRLLEGLTPDRRALLPPDFLRSVQIQASGRIEELDEDAVTQPGIARVDDSLDLGLDALGEPDREWDLQSLPEQDPRTQNHVTGDGPAWVPPSVSVPPRPIAPPQPDPAFDEIDDRTSAPGLSALDVHTASELFELPLGAAPLIEVLSRGRGPFGPREAVARLLLVPDPSYVDGAEQLKHRLKAALDIDLYTGVLFLHRRIPTHLAASSDPASLERAAQELRASGLRVLVIHRDRWLEGALPRQVIAVHGEPPGPITFVLPDGQERIVRRHDLDAAVLGEVLPDEDAHAPGFWMLDILLSRERAPLRLRSDGTDLSRVPDLPRSRARHVARALVRWLADDPEHPPPLDDRFRHVADSARSARSEHAEIHPIEGDFTEYVLLFDRGRREA